jgi:hypothetical protein
MRSFRILSLQLIISIHLCSCCSTEALGVTGAGDGKNTERLSPLGNMSGPMLFKTRINLRRDQYSGLFLIKQVEADTSVRIVYLSELGLSLMDLSYKEDEFEIMKIQDFLNRPLMLKMVEEDFRTLLLDLSAVVPFTEDPGEDVSPGMLKFKHKSQRYRYYYGKGTIPHRIDRKRGCFGRTVYCIQDGEELHMIISHRGIKLLIDLQQLEITGSHDH